MSCWSLEFEGEVLDGMEIVTASPVNVEKKIFDPYRGICRSIVWFNVHEFKPFWELVLHYLIGEA